MPWPVTVAVVAVLSAVALRLRAVTAAGALTGAAVALVYGSASTPAPFAVFALFVLVGSWSSRLGGDRKRRLGVMQENEARRGPSHALANTGFGAALLLSHRLLDLPAAASLAELAACASLAAVLSDTVASEWGTWLGGDPLHVLTGRRVPPGTDGAVTAVGLAASLVAAVLAAATARLLVPLPVSTLALLAAAGFAGNLADTVLGATIEPMLGAHGGSVVNFLASVVGAAIVLAAA